MSTSVLEAVLGKLISKDTQLVFNLYLQEDELKTIKETDESNKPEFQKVFAKITQKSNQANGQVK